MSINILMPALSPTMTEGKLAKWHVKVGDTVKSGQVICEIETDKATMEVEAVDEGKIGQIVVPEGTEGVKVNAVIAVLLEEGETEVKGGAAPPPAPAAPEGRSAAAAGTAKPRLRRSRPAAPRRRKPAAAAGGSAERRSASSPRRSPSASRPRRASISPASRASGPNGRIVKADVENAKPGAAACRRSGCRRARRRPRRRRAAAQPVFTAPGDTAHPAHRDAQGHRAAHARVQADRAALLPDGGARDRRAAGGARRRSTTWRAKKGAKVSVNDMVIKACAKALRDHPGVQRLVDRGRDDPVRRGRHLGRRRHRPRPDHADRAQRRHEGRWRRSAIEMKDLAAPRQDRQAEARGVPGRRLHHLQSRHVRHQALHRHHQPAAGA